MTQYDNEVERQRIILEAEEWAKGVKSIHVHSFNSMWYDDHPEDTDGTPRKTVTDIEYNNGLVVRSRNGKQIRKFGVILKGDALIQQYEKVQQSSEPKFRPQYV